MGTARPRLVMNWLALLLPLLCFISSAPGAFGQAATSPAPMVATNVVLVTNFVVVTVTNYVITTNLVISSNALRPESSPLLKLKLSSALPLNPSWAPPSDSFDWIQLKSGEWLKGRMKSMQNDKIDFESEELDFFEFDWKNVSTLRLPRLHAARFDTLGSITGSLLVTTNEVLVMGDTTNAYSRSELIAITPTGKREIDNWAASLSAGLTFSSGNTRQVDYNAQVEIDRRTPSTHLSFGYLGNLGKIDGVENINNHRLTTEFDYFLSRRLYLIVPFVEYYRDPLQNLEHRLTLGGGVGYDLIKNRRVAWNVTAGPAYQENWYTSVLGGESRQPGALAAVLSSRFDVELTQRLDFLTEMRAQLTSKEVGETTYHSLAKVKFKIHQRLNLNISFTWDRIASPKTDASGLTPRKDDFRLITGLGVEF